VKTLLQSDDSDQEAAFAWVLFAEKLSKMINTGKIIKNDKYWKNYQI
jgi:hypothetical protein